MNPSAASPSVKVTLRIPGPWAHPTELIDRMPADCQWRPDSLVMPDGHQVELDFRPPDDQFASIFASTCRGQPTDEEKKIVEGYTVQVCLTGKGGSFDSAHAMMRAAAAVIRAGGGGVFSDTSGVSFGGTKWCELTDDGGRDALGFAFVGITRGKREAFTVGMHVLGLPDLLMRPSEIGENGSVMIDMITYLCAGQREIGDGHIIADLEGLCFRVTKVKDNKSQPDFAMYNPWGRLKLTSVEEIAESN